ncbi:hypothetical protein TSAR_014428 [Trichomalopsis sarcophagae]|uniref:Peptidase M10 metallopeptidase domain-containing protein n=1 Tax=Trichomalopsis sarcophagae TaxID=543379 RepID=A0A232FEB3_9HYME|nr:hypothetical protein TSAR_014428 [Trichomalopsis sarcophagae]
MFAKLWDREHRPPEEGEQGSRWRVKKLTYKISKYPRVLEKGAVDKEIAKAFSVWSDYTNLQFTPKKSGQLSPTPREGVQWAADQMALTRWNPEQPARPAAATQPSSANP